MVSHRAIVNRLLLDAGALRPRGRRPRAAEDALELRRVGVGVLLAADRRRHAGARPAGRPQGRGLPRGADRGRGHHDAAFRAVDARGLPARARGRRLHHAAPRDLQRRGAVARAAGARQFQQRCRASCTTSTARPRPRSTSPRGNANARDGRRPKRVPIGRPIWNTQMYVLDSGLQPVPAGVAGELYIGGIGPGARLPEPAAAERRALRRQSATARPAAACTAPATSRAGAPTAASTTSGRADHQVKIRGLRIEPGEIEAALLQHPQVAQAAVVAREDAARREAPGGLSWSPAEAADPQTAELRTHLAQALPDYMVPSAFVQPARAAAATERQARPQGAAAARGAGRHALRRATHAHREDPGRPLGRDAAPAARGHPRQLLRARRPLADDRAAGLDDPAAVHDRPAAGHAVPGLDHRRPRRAARPGIGGTARASCRCRARRASRCPSRSGACGS